MVFSGSAEQAVLDYLKAVPHPLIPLKDIDLDQVTLLVVVDTQDASRIGVFKELVGKKGVAVHVYDHHLDVVNPIPAGSLPPGSCNFEVTLERPGVATEIRSLALEVATTSTSTAADTQP